MPSLVRADYYSTLKRLADLERLQEKFGEAHRHYYSVSQNSDGALKLDALSGLALARRAMGHFSEARRQFLRLFPRYRSQQDLMGVAHLLWALGTTERFIGDLTSAARHNKKAVELYQKLGDKSGLAFALSGLGGTYRMQGKASESRQCYRRANSIFRALKDDFGLAYSFCGIGNSYRMQNQIKRGLKFSARAADLYSRLNMKGPLAFVYWSMAQGELAVEQFAKAKRHLSLAEKLFKQVQDDRGLVYSALGWGEFFRRKNSKLAAKFYRRALQSSQKMGLKLEALHARRYLSDSSKVWNSYRKIGVDLTRFRSYNTLP